jgi:hypothetical protein
MRIQDNKYDGLTPEKIWNAMSPEQKEHFLLDHSEHIYGTDGTLTKEPIVEVKNMSFENIPHLARKEFEHHVSKGSYRDGGQIPAKGTPEWHKLQIAKRTVRMSPIMVSVMGGMTMEEAEALLKKHGIEYKGKKYEDGGEVAEDKYEALKTKYSKDTTSDLIKQYIENEESGDDTKHYLDNYLILNEIEKRHLAGEDIDWKALYNEKPKMSKGGAVKAFNVIYNADGGLKERLYNDKQKETAEAFAAEKNGSLVPMDVKKKHFKSKQAFNKFKEHGYSGK